MRRSDGSQTRCNSRVNRGLVAHPPGIPRSVTDARPREARQNADALVARLVDHPPEEGGPQMLPGLAQGLLRSDARGRWLQKLVRMGSLSPALPEQDVKDLPLIGPAALGPVCSGASYSLNDDGRVLLARVLPMLHGDPELAVLPLMQLASAIPWDKGKDVVVTAIGELGNPRAMPELERVRAAGLPREYREVWRVAARRLRGY